MEMHIFTRTINRRNISHLSVGVGPAFIKAAPASLPVSQDTNLEERGTLRVGITTVWCVEARRGHATETLVGCCK